MEVGKTYILNKLNFENIFNVLTRTDNKIDSIKTLEYTLMDKFNIELKFLRD